VGATELSALYTVGWVSPRLVWLVAPLAVAIAWVSRWHGVVLGAIGYVLGLVAGEWIGEAVYQSQLERLRIQRLDPDYLQDWEPTQPGWAIFILVFLGFAVSAIVLARVKPAQRDR
jgi:hypothetical protein